MTDEQNPPSTGIKKVLITVAILAAIGVGIYAVFAMAASGRKGGGSHSHEGGTPHAH